jgi:hypothetical protein
MNSWDDKNFVAAIDLGNDFDAVSTQQFDGSAADVAAAVTIANDHQQQRRALKGGEGFRRARRSQHGGNQKFQRQHVAAALRVQKPLSC